MPAALTYPGVYVEEIPSGVRTIVGVATSIAAFIGTAKTGPTDRATVINSFPDYERAFGGLWAGSPMSFMVRDFFLNGGAQAVVVRVFHAPDASPAGATPAAFFKPVLGAWKLIAASPGTSGANLRVKVEKVDAKIGKSIADAMGLATDDLFNVTVRDAAPGGATEVFLNVSTKDSPRRVDKVFEAESNLVRWDTPYAEPAALTFVQDDPKGPQFSLDEVWTLEKALADAIKAKGAGSPEAAKAQGELDKKLKANAGGLGDSGALKKEDFTGDQVGKKGIYALEQLFATDGLFNLLCIAPYTASSTAAGNGDVEQAVIDEAAAYCEKRRAMLLIDAPTTWTSIAKAHDNFVAQTDFTTTSRNAGVFFPRLRQPNPFKDDRIEPFAATGAVAGIFARTDTQRGVWKAPAGIEASLVAVPELAISMTDEENGNLNPVGINCIRAFPVYGRVIWGSRTLRGADQMADEYKYIPVRRTALYIEESLYRGLKWVVFEPNDEPLWAQIRLNAGAFMHNLFRQGAFQGRTPREAYFVRCDSTTTTQNDINLGIVNIHVGFAPLKPAEFVVIKLQQIAGQIEV